MAAVSIEAVSFFCVAFDNGLVQLLVPVPAAHPEKGKMAGGFGLFRLVVTCKFTPKNALRASGCQRVPCFLFRLGCEVDGRSVTD